eukprot:TRINITY_DN7977_c0_g2_i4.p1 TRINITY_DN7977_c0_g2~~TRINITY_DN7977_c0_g2_i4.p1  ORF type:complete len:472 (+),score=62.13 TRINITY_DN7977_c0_g2_i4:76-1416(+)
MAKTKKGDFIHGTAFEVRGYIMLQPNPDDMEGSERSSLKNVLRDAVGRGVSVRLLINCNVMQYLWTTLFCVQMNWICGYTCCGIDNRHYNWVMGNLHTKMWVIKMGNETVAYNGGIDISLGRWDTEKHDNSKARQMNGKFYGGAAGYHDSAMRMLGPIVVDYERHFHQSWNDPYPAFFPFHILPKYDWVEPPHTRYTPSRFQVQLLRTLGCKGSLKGYYQNFAPRGELSGFRGLLKMIENAKEYLYMEDQFFNHAELMAAIKQRLPVLKFVILLTNDQATPALFSDARYYLQHQALKLLMEDSELSKKVFIYRLVRDTDMSEPLYVHTKLFMADDEYVITGSFGAERSALTNDREAGMGIYDKEGKYIKEMRKRLWSEHLMLPLNHPILEDPVRGSQEWERQAKDAKGRVRSYFPKNASRNIITDLFEIIYEIDGRCCINLAEFHT